MLFMEIYHIETVLQPPDVPVFTWFVDVQNLFFISQLPRHLFVNPGAGFTKTPLARTFSKGKFFSFGRATFKFSFSKLLLTLLTSGSTIVHRHRMVGQNSL